MKQIVKDLHTNAQDRLRLWIKDTVMRCEVVDIEEREGIAIILNALAHELIYGLVKLGMSRQDFMTIIQNAYDMEKKRAASNKELADDGK
jgi:hypothetical protein